MWKFVVLSSLIISWTEAQNPGSRPFDNGHGWDIRLAVPGEPGRDYPTLNSIPKTSFSCSGKEPGYYADIETNCQVFRVCTLGSTYGFQSFLCPNGTLFNQAVFVCDWWMKVNCKKSGELYKINNEKYGNLKLGPQFMTNIKKMITSPMRNPYDEIYTKNQLIVTQEYNPSQIQLLNNKNPNSAYFQAKQTETSQLQNIYSTADTLFAASTPSIQYSTNFSIFRPTNNHNIQQHKHDKSYVLPNRTGMSKNLHFLNSHSGQTSQSQNIVDKYIPTQNYQRSLLLSNPQENVKNNINSNHKGGNQIFTYNKSKNKHTEFGIEFAKQQLNQNIKQDRPLNSDNDSQTRQSKTAEGVGNKTKQNLVSNETPPAIITKTLAFRRLIKDPTNGNPKSRITFKTWILRPSKNSKLITPYIYRRSSNLFEKVIDENSVVDNPEIQAGEVKTENSYVYNPPTIKLDSEIITISQDQSANSDSVTTSQPEILTTYNTPTTLPTKPSSLYLIPTTFKPSSLLYIPPAESEKQINRQYLSPFIKNSKIVSISSSPRPFTTLKKKDPSFFISKQTQINTNQNNLAFSDILTREKLDITVDKIVKDTNDVLETASPEEFQYVKTDVYSADYPFDNYLHLDSDLDTQSDEKLTLHPPAPPLPRNSRLIAIPSSKLEPPIESFINFNQMKNPISRLPFYEEFTRRPNIIERTISLKITIPENIAQILFKNSTISNSDTLEILKTDNSNNWLLINKVNNEDADVTPIGRLIWNQNSNISNSQDLVFSLLLDSINAAKQFNNVAQQNIVSPAQPHTQSQFQNIENEKLQQISKDISKLTSSQFSPTNNSASLRLANQGRNFNSLSKDKTKATTKSYVQKQVLQQQNLIPQKHIQKQVSYSLPTNIDDVNIQINSDKLYSGQLYKLPVPIVTKEIYNSPFPANFKLPTNALTIDTISNLIDDGNQSNVDVEIIKWPNNFKSVNKPTEANVDQGSSANAVKNTLKLPENGITAQLQDNIVGTLPYLQDDSKIIKYKKDQTYYIYSYLNNDNENQNIIGNDFANIVLPQNEKLPQLSTFQLIPSLSYTLQNGKEKEDTLKTFQFNEYRSPQQGFNNENANLIRREEAIANVGYVVERPKSIVEKPRVLQSLYDGPNSYSTPQRSVVNSIEEQNDSNGSSNFNSKIEKLDTNEDTNNYGYPQIIPAKRFLF